MNDARTPPADEHSRPCETGCLLISNALTASHADRLRALKRRDLTRASRFRGVSRKVRRGPLRIRWRTAIAEGNRFSELGTFKHEWQAAAVYDTALIALGYPPVNFTEASLRSASPPGSFEHALAYVRERLRLSSPPPSRAPFRPLFKDP
jgi:hypothetical protein